MNTSDIKAFMNKPMDFHHAQDQESYTQAQNCIYVVHGMNARMTLKKW